MVAEPKTSAATPAWGAPIAIDRPCRVATEGAARLPLSHPLVMTPREACDGGSIQAASKSLGVSYRHARGLRREAEWLVQPLT